VEFGTVTQSAMAFAQLLGALSLIVAQFQSISAFAAVVTRLGLLQGAIGQQSVPRRPIEIVEDDSRIAYEGLTLKTPDHGRVLIKDLSLQIERGRRVLISEKHGAGKSALFRATAGLWVTGEGRIVRPPLAHVMFLPQRPYVVPGSLREQLLYGLPPEKNDDERIHAISQGEEQLFAIARLLLANPAFAFLDQSVSALTTDRGKRIYRILAATDITYVSIGDRPFLQDFHETLLELSDGGRWRQSPCRELAAV
jgi:putative ATP-binding cassette transporter